MKISISVHDSTPLPQSWTNKSALLTPRDDSALKALAANCAYSPRRIAAHFGVSQRQLHRLFLAHLSCSPRQWLREERMQCALRLLHTSLSVKQVAYELGFAQQSQFCRDFRLRFGRSPSAELQQRRDTLAALLGATSVPSSAASLTPEGIERLKDPHWDPRGP